MQRKPQKKKVNLKTVKAELKKANEILNKNNKLQRTITIKNTNYTNEIKNYAKQINNAIKRAQNPQTSINAMKFTPPPTPTKFKLTSPYTKKRSNILKN